MTLLCTPCDPSCTATSNVIQVLVQPSLNSNPGALDTLLICDCNANIMPGLAELLNVIAEGGG